MFRSRSSFLSQQLLRYQRQCYVTDLRSDTVTVPCDKMKMAMINAPVGDDVFGEDETVKKLERYTAELTGKESGLFCATGTMTNQIALVAHLNPMESLLCDRRCHIFNYEVGGVAYHSRAHMIPIHHNPVRNFLTADDFKENSMENDIHYAETKLFLLENSLLGSIMPLNEMEKIYELAQHKRFITHVDGARLWNASCATGIPLSEYGKYTDSISLCLSKGLGAPVGSVLVGEKNFIDKCRKLRKLFGGGWRQGGLLAAAGLYAIENNWSLMKDVHERTKNLASGLEKLGVSTADNMNKKIETNIFYANFSNVFSLKGKKQWCIEDLKQKLSEKDILIAGSRGEESIRMVLHHQVSSAAIDQILEITENYINENKI